MNNQQPIDLSKAYAGQIAHLKDGSEYTIKLIKKLSEPECYEIRFASRQLWYYTQDGTHLGGSSHNIPMDLNISSLENDYYIEAARLEGEIKGLEYFYEYAMVNDMQMRSLLLKKLNDLKAQLKTLTNENS